MNIVYSHKSLMDELKVASKNIKQANKGLPCKVQINKNFELHQHETHLTMRIGYVDGDGKYQVYNIAL